ncbi:pyridoxamine 5'-phosphate oxidase family protein [Nocardia wallacei]|uniref:pyridoxamine 5'-phosphate oxidase family protein n=1 Tax=Nocardia wallacei TaxID=480035 RepID=UPI002456482B|nr:pyridoxamine 5'-phosphate oxidase family protein [Nocardia wallacei]
MEETLGSRELSTAQSLRLLSGVRFGRVVFSRYALPTIRPVNHAVVDDAIVIYANPGTTLSSDRQVVTYEADTLDPATLLGWCVVVTGAAEELTDPDEIRRCRRVLPAALPGPRDRIIRIHPDIVLGIEYLTPTAVGNSDPRWPPD